MASPMRQIVIPIPRPKLLTAPGGNPGLRASEQPKAFQFDVTWHTLLAHLQPVETSQTDPVAVVVPEVEIVPRETPSRALQVVEPPTRPRDEEAAWEMVVPKMVRRPL